MYEIFRYEWRTNRRSFTVWAIVIILFQMMFAGFGDLYMNNEDMLKVLEQFPTALLEGFGFDPEMLSSFEGWMGGEPLVFFNLLLAAFAAIWAASAAVRERDTGTADFLYTLPLTRGQILAGKAAAHISAVLIIAILSYGVTLVFGTWFSTVSNPLLLLWYTLAGVMTALAFAGIAYVISVIVSTERTGMTTSIGLVLLSFLLNMLSGLHESLAWLSKLSLFTAFNGKGIFVNESLPWLPVFITIILYVGGMVTSRFVFVRRDI